MKRMYTILMAVMLMPMFLSAENPSYEITGKWFDNYNSAAIKVRQTRRGVKAKGLTNYKKWRSFDYDRRRGYRDRDGNSLRINRGGQLVYKKHRSGRTYRFDRNRYNHNRYDRGYDYRPSPPTWSSPSARNRYYIRELNEQVYLQQNGNRLRSKRQGGEWIYYTQNRYRKNEYTDTKGNRYVRNSDGGYRWVRWDREVILSLRQETQDRW